MMDFQYCPVCGSELIYKTVDDRQRKVCQRCGWIYYKNPISAVAAMVSDGDRLLLVKRDIEPYKGEWCVPGGFIEFGESLNDACLRELREETSITGVPGKVIGAHIQKSKIYGEVLIVGIEVIPDKNEPVPGDDARSADFIYFTDLPEIKLESHSRLIEEYLSYLKVK